MKISNFKPLFLTLISMSYGVSAASFCVAPKGVAIDMGGQTSIIVWDAETKTQHFFRKAGFETSSPDFSFITPTPTVPSFGKADPKAFEQIRTVIRTFYTPRSLGAALERGSDSISESSVEVLQTVEVAGYEIKTLRADDATALETWLNENKYETPPGIKSWLNYYIKKKWVLSAFKFKKKPDQKEGEVSSSLIRMSFKTDKPFHPFYVPTENLKGANGMANIYFISSSAYKVSNPNLPISSDVTGVIPSRAAKEISQSLSDENVKIDIVNNPVIHSFSGRFNSAIKEDAYFELTVGSVPDVIKNSEANRRKPTISERVRITELLPAIIGFSLVGIGIASWLATRIKTKK